MAKAKIVTDAEVPEGAPAPPTLREAARASTDAESQRLAELVEKAGGPAAPVEEAPPAKSDVEAYNEWYAALPEDKRNLLITNVVNNYSRQLDETYGPEVGQVLAAVRENPDLKKKLSRLTDEKFREWVFDHAAAIYDDPRFAEPTAADGTIAADPKFNELEKEVRSLKTEREQEKAQREYEAYRQKRVDEYQALLNSFPALKFGEGDTKGAGRVNAIIEEAERRSQARKQLVSYADVAKEYIDMWDVQATNPPPRSIPAASSTTIPGPQAPRTKFESRAGINSMLDKHGGISALASALRK